ncbi:SDR family oxidoreductase [Cyanothece sp. BG0011]|uniref:SDR family oxidoreductase n=1 Tax=Cyanothece sp. BG0011 TaxID=2082950 RepID=UPI000D1DBE33|nr:SDR family oxidoreductase [Cyanothece sp. BG0011]
MLNNSDLILVAGATGGVGQLVVAKLLEKNISVRVLTRNQSKAKQMFNEQVDIVVGDIRYPDTLTTATKDVTHIICCTGTTAFPSQRWDFVNLFDPQNTPQAVDGEGVKNLILAAPSSLKRFVFVSSCGVLRKDKLPFNILNAFGVLDAKLYAENTLKSSGLPYTIIRPGRLIDGPYTSYDLNTLLRAKTDGSKAVILGTGDTLNGETSRIDVANVCVECLNYDVTINKAIDLINSGDRPAVINWEKLFSQIS